MTPDKPKRSAAADGADWTPGCGSPSPADIASACEAIRAEWTETQRRQRLVVEVEPVTVATASVEVSES